MKIWLDQVRDEPFNWDETQSVSPETLDRPELATVVLATLRGLLMDLNATGDADRTARAWRDLLDAISRGRTAAG